MRETFYRDTLCEKVCVWFRGAEEGEGDIGVGGMIVSRKELLLNLKIGEITIEKSTITLLKSTLTEPFRISLGTQYDYNECVVEFVSREANGYGEGSIDTEITGESPAGVFETIAYILEGMKNRFILKETNSVDS